MKLHHILLLIFLLSLPLTTHADKASKLNKNGIESFKENNLEESARFFTEALVERPDSPDLRFNRGTALSATDKKDEAVNELEKAAQTFEKEELSAAAHFNAGNTFFATEDLNEAIESYKKAVKLDQSSRDIRHNLELAVRKLQEQQQQQQQEKQDNKQEKDDSDEQQQEDQEQEKENEEKDDESEKKNNEQQDKQDQQQEQQEQSQQQENEQQSMTPEEAQRILDAIEDEEKKAFSLRREKMRTEMRQGDDW